MNAINRCLSEENVSVQLNDRTKTLNLNGVQLWRNFYPGLLLSATMMLATCVRPLRSLTNSLIRAK